MSTNMRQFVIVGVDAGYDWDKRPEDEDDDDAWFDRHINELFNYYQEDRKVGDYGILRDGMDKRYCIIGKMLATAMEEEALNLVLTDADIAASITEVGGVLREKYGIEEWPKLRILTHYS